MSTTEFPKKISENGWYELSNGETVRGEEAAREAEERLAEGSLAADMEEAEQEYEAGETTTLSDFERELDEEDDPKGPLAGNFVDEEDDLEGKVCINCGASATYVDDPPTAKKAYFCTVHRPVYLR